MTSFEERLKEAREKAKKLDGPTSWQDNKTNTFQQTVTNDLNKTGNTLVQQQRNQNSAQVAARAGGSLMEQATVEAPKQSPFKTAFDVVDRGAGYFNQGVASTIDFVANAMPRLEGAVFGVDPAATFTGQVLKPVTDATGKFKDWVDQTVAGIDQRVQTDTKDNKAASIAANLGSQAVAALPNAVLAFLSGGASLGTQLPAQSAGISGAVISAATKALQNPLTKVSFVQSLGNSYEEAKASGASDVEAMTAATLSSLFNSAIETGGGIETLPGEIRGKDLSTGKKAWEWFKSALEEGGEEVVQSVITNMTNKGIFDSDKPLVSTTDENAVANPSRMLQEFGSGAAVGGLLGGGQMLGNALMGMGNGRIATPPAEVRNDSVKPTPQQPTVESVMPTVQPKAAKPIQQQTETEVEELPIIPGNGMVQNAVPQPADDGILVYRGYNRSMDGTERNLSYNRSINDVLGYTVHPEVELLPFVYYTDSFQDAENYANMDYNFLESLKERYGESEGLKSYKILTGKEAPNKGTVLEHRINPKKVLDLTSLGEETTVGAVYRLLSQETGLPETSLHEDNLDDRLLLMGVDPEESGFQPFKMLRNEPVVNGDHGTRFFKFLKDFGYDAVRYRENGATHHAVITEQKKVPPTSVDDIMPNLPGKEQDNKPAMGAADSGFDPISHASIEYGAIPPGEKAARIVDLPVSVDGETRVGHFARTGAEAPVSNKEMAQRILNMVAENKLSHEIFTDDAALEAAGAKIAEAYENGQGYNVYIQFLQDVAAGKAGKDLMATGSLLYADAAANGDYDSASELFVALTDLQTRAGQTVQAARLLKKLSPAGRVWVVNKIVGKIQNEVNQGRKPDNQIKIEVDGDLIDAFKNAKTAKAQAEAMDNIYKAVAEQMPTTIGDAVNEFRYFMMLGNVSAHLKNLSGNFGQTIMVALKDTIATAVETGVDATSKAFGGKGIQRTKAFLNLASESDRALLGNAWADYENVQDDIAGAGKYKDSARYQVSKHQNYWKLNDPKTKAGELVSKGLQMAEKAPQANSKLMNMEDRWFSQPNYAVALAGYMKANNLTEPNDAAREYAVKEAQKATFRDLNAVSKWAKSLGKTKFTKFLVDSVFPFKSTPANVGVRAVEYSPAGLVVTLGKAAVAAKKGEFSAAQFIDDLSANATGSLLAGLGYLLAQSGVLRVAGIGDDKEKQQQALEGYKNNSIYNVPIAFISPAAATLLLGGAIYEAKATKELDGRSYGASDSLNALSGITDPILETTMLDGLRGILSTVRSSGGTVDGKLLTDIGIQIVGNYIGSFMSSQLSRVYAATDDATRTTYVDKTKDDTIANLPSVQKLVQGLQYKSPHRTDMVQDIDAWGRPIEGNKGSGGTDFENFMESLFNVITPTYPGKVQETAVDKELKRLYRAEGVDNSDVSLFMKDASKDFEVNGQTVYLTGEQWEQYQTDRGQTAMEVREAIMNSKAYKNLSDTTKAVAMDIALEYATGYAKDQLDVGYKFKAKWMAALLGSSSEKIAKTIIERAIARTED